MQPKIKVILQLGLEEQDYLIHHQTIYNMHQNLTEKDIDFMEMFHDSVAMTESLFPENIKAPHTWGEIDTKLITLRPYQFAMTNFSYMYANDFDKTPRQNFLNKVGAGKLFNIASRNIGKSYKLIIDAVLNFTHSVGEESCVFAHDFEHLKKICTPIANFINYHSLMKIFKRKGKSNVRFTAGSMEADSMTGSVLYGKNEKIKEGDDAGQAFHSLHCTYWSGEESSYMSSAGTEKRIDAVDTKGYIEKLSGIPELRIGSPLGDILTDPQNKNYICRIPQFVREDFTSETEEEMIQKYGGKDTIAFRLNVEAELIEGVSGFWDMERLKKACRYGKRGTKIKSFEIGKRTYLDFEKLIVVERQPCEACYLTADIGMGNRPTEILITFFDGEKYHPTYNITLNKLISEEQAEIFKWLYNQLGSCFIGIDTTTDYQIGSMLKKMGIPSESITEVKLNSKIDIGFQTNSKGQVLRDSKGFPLTKEEWTMQWAMNRLEHLFYNGKIEQPIDTKWEREFTGFIIKTDGVRKSYGSSTTDDFHQAWQCFAITQWINEFNHLKNTTQRKKRCLGVIG